MNKYVLKVIIGARDNPTRPTTISLPETVFIAVSAYQSMAVTQMKINHNPYAKAFKYKIDKNSLLLTSATAGLLEDTPSEFMTLSPDRMIVGPPYQQENQPNAPAQQVSVLQTVPMQTASQDEPAAVQQISVLGATESATCTASKHVSVLQTASQQISVLKSTAQNPAPLKKASEQMPTLEPALPPTPKQTKIQEDSGKPQEPGEQKGAAKKGSRQRPLQPATLDNSMAQQAPNVTARQVVMPERQPFGSRQFGSRMSPSFAHPLASQVGARKMVMQHTAQRQPAGKTSQQAIPKKLPAQRNQMTPQEIAQELLQHVSRQKTNQQNLLRHITPQEIAAEQLLQQQLMQQQLMQQQLMQQQLLVQQLGAQQVLNPEEMTAQQYLLQQQLLQQSAQINVLGHVTPVEIAREQLIQQQLLAHQQRVQRKALRQLTPEEIAREQMIQQQILAGQRVQRNALRRLTEEERAREQLIQQHLIAHQQESLQPIIPEQMATEQFMQQQLAHQQEVQRRNTELTPEEFASGHARRTGAQRQLFAQEAAAAQILQQQLAMQQLAAQQNAMRQIASQNLAAGQPTGMKYLLCPVYRIRTLRHV